MPTSLLPKADDVRGPTLRFLDENFTLRQKTERKC